jgi:hypothetical protein
MALDPGLPHRLPVRPDTVVAVSESLRDSGPLVGKLRDRQTPRMARSRGGGSGLQDTEGECD